MQTFDSAGLTVTVVAGDPDGAGHTGATLTLVMFAMQAAYAAARRLVNPFLGFFISTYDVLIAIDAVLRSIASTGAVLPGFTVPALKSTSTATPDLVRTERVTVADRLPDVSIAPSGLRIS